MKKSGFGAIAALLFLSNLALAQDAKPSFDQYPSFLELSATNTDGTQSVLRCGYTAKDGHITVDTAFHEISVMNQAHKSYSRIQRLDGFMIATSIDPSGGGGLLVELVEPNGTIRAKNCQNDEASDMIRACRSISPFTFVDQIKAGDQQIATQCEELIKQGMAQINPALADPQKIEQFKNGLRQKVNILAAP